MTENDKYLMWNVIPVRFTKAGAWEVAVRDPVIKKVLYTICCTLLQLNVLVEYLFDDQIEMQVPVVPLQKSWVYRLTHNRFLTRRDPATHP